MIHWKEGTQTKIQDPLVLEGVYSGRLKTTDVDTRRITIRAEEKFLRENSGKEDINITICRLMKYGRMVLESAKKQKLTCEPLEEEFRLMELKSFKSRIAAQKFALTLACDPIRDTDRWEGPFIRIKGGEKEDGKGGIENRRPRLRNRISRLSEGKQSCLVKVKKPRSSLCEDRPQNLLFYTKHSEVG